VRTQPKALRQPPVEAPFGGGSLSESDGSFRAATVAGEGRVQELTASGGTRPASRPTRSPGTLRTKSFFRLRRQTTLLTTTDQSKMRSGEAEAYRALNRQHLREAAPVTISDEAIRPAVLIVAGQTGDQRPVVAGRESAQRVPKIVALRFPHFSACISVRSERSNGTDSHPHNVDI
jgi:hypothetical protein